mgnify:CR=1 FL=1
MVQTKEKSILLNAKKLGKNFLCDIPAYWSLAPRNRPRTWRGLMKKTGAGGYWCVQAIDKLTGEVTHCQLLNNAITDNGALSMWKNTMNYTAGGIGVANIIAVDQSLGYTTLATTIGSGGTVTSIVVGALTGPTIPSGTVICVGAGGATKLFLQLSASITGAGTYSVVSATGPGSSIASGANIRYANKTELTAAGSALASMPTTDASSLSAPVSYTAALPTGNFTISGSGQGNRAMTVNNSGSYLFSTTANSNGSTATVANYTAGWLVNTNPVASTAQTFVHVAFDAPIPVNSSTNGQVTITEQL